jgi:hypothetical protein
MPISAPMLVRFEQAIGILAIRFLSSQPISQASHRPNTWAGGTEDGPATGSGVRPRLRAFVC